MKITNGILALLFVSFAVVQYNDPDPWLWIVAYGAIAALFLGAIFRKIPHFILYIFAGLFVIWGLILAPDFWAWLQNGTPSIVSEMKTTEPHIELVREFLGIIICLAALTFHYYKNTVRPIS